MTDEPLVTVGRVGKAHGLRGEVSVEAWTDDPQLRFAAGTAFSTPGGLTLTVTGSRNQSGRWVVAFAGVDDRTAAEALRGTQLQLAASDRPILDDPDDFYDSDLIGLRARSVDGTFLGPVIDVVHAPAADYLVLTVDETERLVPFVKAIVPTVDLAAGEVIIDAPDGLFEL